MKANLDKNLAPAWVSGRSYSTGEFCLYNKRLYICIEDNSDTEFDNSKWEIRNLVDLVSGLNSNLIGDFDVVYSNTITLGSTKTLSHKLTKSYKQVFIILLVFNTNSTNAIINDSDVIKEIIINNGTALSHGNYRTGIAIARLENVGTSDSISYTAFGEVCRVIEIGY